jgi:hypothetical protein
MVDRVRAVHTQGYYELTFSYLIATCGLVVLAHFIGVIKLYVGHMVLPWSHLYYSDGYA